MQSPDRWDDLPAVNHPPKRLFAAGLVILAVVFFTWLGMGQVDSRVAGRCILLGSHGISEITSAAEGRLDGLAVHVGDQVRPGQVIATLRRPEFEQRLVKAQARLADLRARQQEADALIERSGSLGKTAAAREQAIVAERLATIGQRLALLEKRVQAQQALYADGLTTRQNLVAAQDQREAVVLEQAALKSRAKQLQFQASEDKRNLDGERIALALQVAQAEREVALLNKQRDELMTVKSAYNGRVVEVKAQNGVALATGSPVATVELAEGDERADLIAVLFVDANTGKQLKVGMATEVTPSYVKRQEFGFIRGTVANVSAFPASRAAIGQLLQNPDVVKELTNDKATMEVRVRLDRAASGNGYQWSAAARRPPPVHSGALCSADVLVKRKRPIEMIMPALKRWTGIQ
nr:NHLP bacteriocin system secretion protein [Massilia sp. TS11]